MQYALMKIEQHSFLIDANEWILLDGINKKPVVELPLFNEDDLDYSVCYGGYLLNPNTPEKDIHSRLDKEANFWLATIDSKTNHCCPIAFYAIKSYPIISTGAQRIVPFAALIKANDTIIESIAGYSTFSVSAFLRVNGYDVVTNILNRKGIYSFNGIEKRNVGILTDDNWLNVVREDRAIRIANKLIGCEHH